METRSRWVAFGVSSARCRASLPRRAWHRAAGPTEPLRDELGVFLPTKFGLSRSDAEHAYAASSTAHGAHQTLDVGEARAGRRPVGNGGPKEHVG
jgi:hypothetical protein